MNHMKIVSYPLRAPIRQKTHSKYLLIHVRAVLPDRQTTQGNLAKTIFDMLATKAHAEVVPSAIIQAVIVAPNGVLQKVFSEAEGFNVEADGGGSFTVTIPGGARVDCIIVGSLPDSSPAVLEVGKVLPANVLLVPAVDAENPVAMDLSSTIATQRILDIVDSFETIETQEVIQLLQSIDIASIAIGDEENLENALSIVRQALKNRLDEQVYSMIDDPASGIPAGLVGDYFVDSFGLFAQGGGGNFIGRLGGVPAEWQGLATLSSGDANELSLSMPKVTDLRLFQSRSAQKVDDVVWSERNELIARIPQRHVEDPSGAKGIFSAHHMTFSPL